MCDGARFVKMPTLLHGRRAWHPAAPDLFGGSIAVGKVADVVLVDGDPTANISDVRKTVLVVKDGIEYEPKELYAVLGVKP